MQTNDGMNNRRALITTDMVEVAVGTDDTAPTPADVALGAEVDRELIESLNNGTTGVCRVRTRFLAALAATIVEAGMFDTGADLTDHIVFAPVVKPAGVELLLDITYTISD